MMSSVAKITSVIGECMSMEHWWDDTNREKPKYLEENITLSITNPTQTSLGPDCIHSKRVVTNYPSHDAAVVFLLAITVVSKDPFECLKICLFRDRLVC